ncbi:unnamed protein product, partial [Ranitomeya imitator]
MIWIPLVMFGTYLLETTGLNVYRFSSGDKCQDQITHSFGYYVLAEELATIECPILQYVTLDLSALQLVWTRKGSEILDATEEPRIQRKTDALWFLPAVEEDTGIYTCILRNASYCVEISLSLNVMSDTPASFPYVKYEQIAFESMEFEMICPALPYFITEDMNMTINWFKDGEPLTNDGSKYRYLDGTTYASINDVCHDDEGYYKCQLTFSLENVDYSISRIIQLRIIEQWKGQHPVILNPNRKAIAAAIGSRLVIPCKVFAGHGDSDLMVWWLANDTFLNNYSKDQRVTQGLLQNVSLSKLTIHEIVRSLLGYFHTCVGTGPSQCVVVSCANSAQRGQQMQFVNASAAHSMSRGVGVEFQPHMREQYLNSNPNSDPNQMNGGPNIGCFLHCHLHDSMGNTDSDLRYDLNLSTADQSCWLTC